jgi:hypothetical protein
MKLCKHCKHCKQAFGHYFCTVDQTTTISPVTGDDIQVGGRYCIDKRTAPDDNCGEEGRLYEYKPPLDRATRPYFMWEAK